MYVDHTLTRYSHVCLQLTCAPNMASTVNRSSKHSVYVESTAHRYCPGRPLRSPCMTYMLCRYGILWLCFEIMAVPQLDPCTVSNDSRTRIFQMIMGPNKKRAFFDSTLDLELRKKLVKCYIRSITLYGTETCTIRAVDQKHLETFETWCWRRMEKIS